MIVQCTSCRARFRVADDKVPPDRGVKVRCTKCSTVFKVTRADAADAQPAAPAGRDPFGLDADGLGLNFDAPNAPPTPARGNTGPERISRSPAPTTSSSTGLKKIVPNLPPTVSLTYGAASPHQSLDLELSLGPPTGRTGGVPLPTGPTPPPTPSSGSLGLSGTAIDAALDAAMASAAEDPFGANSIPPSPSYSTPALGYQAPQQQPYPSQQQGYSQPTPGYGAPALFAPQQGYGQQAGYAAQHTPMGVSPVQLPMPAQGYDAPTATAMRPVAFPSPSYGQPPLPPPQTTIDPFSDITFGDQGGAGAGDPFAISAQPPAPPPPSMPTPVLPSAPQNDPWVGLIANAATAGRAQEPSDPFSDISTQPAMAAVQAAPRETTREPARDRVATPSKKEPEPAADAGDETGAGGAEAGDGIGSTSSAREIEFEATQGHKLDLDYGTLSGVGGLATPTPPTPEPRREVVDLGRIAIGSSGKLADKRKEDDQKPADPKIALRTRIRKEFASAVFNVASASIVGLAGLVAIASVRAPRPLTMDDVGFPVVWLAFGFSDGAPAHELRATQIHSATYVTHGSVEFFYVQGLAVNDSSSRRDAMTVNVEILRNGQQVDHAESVARLDATPEQLYSLDSVKNDELQKRLITNAVSLSVEAGERAPFIAIFKLSGHDAAGCDIRVTARDGVPGPLKAAAARLGKSDDDDAPAAAEDKEKKEPAEPTPVADVVPTKTAKIK